MLDARAYSVCRLGASGAAVVLMVLGGESYGAIAAVAVVELTFER